MCCLMYEHQTYVEARRRFPREGKSLRTSLGQEKLRALREEVANAGEAGPERGQT